MEYKKQEFKNFNIHYINTNRFKAINIEIFFTKNFDYNDIPLSNLLCNIMNYSTKKYNTKNKYSIKKEDLYSLKTIAKFGINGASNFINFSLEFLHPKYTENKMIEESLEFLKEILFNPNVSNNAFDNKIFEIVKNSLVSKIKAIKDNPSILSELNFRKIMYENTPTAYSSLGQKEDYDKINANDLYKFYLKLFNDYKIDIFILGELNNEYEDLITNYFIKLLKNINITNKEKISLFIKTKEEKRINKVKEKFDFNQSQLIMGYRIKDISEYELRYVFSLYNIILGNVPNSILFSKLRGENSLCYGVTSNRNLYNPSLIISSGINKVNSDKATKLITNCIKDMTNLSKIKPLFNVSLKSINTILNDYYDDVKSIIDYYYNNEFESIDDIELRRQKLTQIKPEEVVMFAKKVYLTTTYLLEGEAEE